MTQIFFAGHNNFGNRGCEALVRSVSGLIRQSVGDARFVTPSVALELDSRQWPAAAASGIDFVPAASFPSNLKWWNRARRVAPVIEKLARPSHHLQSPLAEQMAKSQLVVMTGGDTISLDYDLPSLYDHAGYVDTAKRMGVPVMLWAGSVGPFTKKPHVERFMRRHLADYDAITVRESETFAYLRGLGLDNVVQATDPAFTLLQEEFDISGLLPDAPNGVIGLNVSPLVRGYLPTPEARERLDAEVAAFVRELVEQRGYGVVLLPHVGPLDGSDWNSDYHYMQGLVEKYQLTHANIRMAPRTLNASQLKYLIAKFRFFIGARTHATIAAFSTGVPTVSIAYSVKAKGINRDLFGDISMVLDTPKVSLETLRRYLGELERREDEIKALLAERIPEWRQRAAIPVASVLRLLGQG